MRVELGETVLVALRHVQALGGHPVAQVACAEWPDAVSAARNESRKGARILAPANIFAGMDMTSAAAEGAARAA